MIIPISVRVIYMFPCMVCKPGNCCAVMWIAVRVSDLANAMLDVSVLHDRSRRVRFELSNAP